MALTYIFAALPNAIVYSLVGVGGSAGSGKTYQANSAGFITGVTGADAITLQGRTGGAPQLVAATGNTADRPSPSVSPALTGALNNSYPAPTLGLPFYDQTLSNTYYFVGTQRSSTGWVDRTGAAG